MIVKLLKSLLVLHLQMVHKMDKLDLVIVLEVDRVDLEAYHQLLLHQSMTVIKMVLT